MVGPTGAGKDPSPELSRLDFGYSSVLFSNLPASTTPATTARDDRLRASQCTDLVQYRQLKLSLLLGLSPALLQTFSRSINQPRFHPFTLPCCDNQHTTVLTRRGAWINSSTWRTSSLNNSTRLLGGRPLSHGRRRSFIFPWPTRRLPQMPPVLMALRP